MVEIKNLRIERVKSEKKGTEYNVLVAVYNVDGEEQEQVISFDSNVMLVLADLSPSAFDRKLSKIGDKIVIPTFKGVK